MPQISYGEAVEMFTCDVCSARLANSTTIAKLLSAAKVYELDNAAFAALKRHCTARHRIEKPRRSDKTGTDAHGKG